MRSLPVLVIALALSTASPVLAAASKKSSTSKKKSSDKKKPASSSPKATPAPTEEAPMPQGGLDLSKPPAPSKPAPTMSFDAVDVSGKSGDRQRLDVALQQFKAESYEQAVVSANEILKDPK